MRDLIGMMNALNRPNLLVTAARFGVDEYARETHLKRVLKSHRLPRPGEAILALLELEATFEDKRVAKSAEYSIAHHVEVLIALLGEGRFLKKTRVAPS